MLHPPINLAVIRRGLADGDMVFIHRDGRHPDDPRIGGGFVDHQNAGDRAFLVIHLSGEVKIHDMVAIPEVEFAQTRVMGFQFLDADRGPQQAAEVLDPTGQVRAGVRPRGGGLAAR